jgi:hypothetical protein
MKKVNIAEAKTLLETQDTRLVKYRHALVEVPFEDLLYMIEPMTLAQKYVDFYNAHPAFQEVPAGAKHHHWWKGGLEEHVKEMIGLGFDLLSLYPGDLQGKITRTDLIVTCFLHDFAKIWIYREITNEDRAKRPDKFLPAQEFTYINAKNILDDESKTLLELAKHGIAPSEKQWSGVLFCEGGWSDANFGFRGPTSVGDAVMAQNPLVPMMHMLDIYSSQILGKSLYGSAAETKQPSPAEAAELEAIAKAE